MLVGSSLLLFIISKGDSKVLNVEVLFGDNICFDGVLLYKEMQFLCVYLVFGESDIVNIGIGFSISVNLV